MDFSKYRSEFPALSQVIEEHKIIRFDNAAGTQVPQRVIDRVTDCLTNYNANTDGVFEASIQANDMLYALHQALADFLNAKSPNETILGPNMTTLTQMMSRSIGRHLQAGDEIILSRLDHDANVAPWLDLQEKGIVIRFADIHPADVTLNWESLREQFSARTKLVAITCASNAFGTITDAAAIVKLAHEHGAWVWLDAVHYAPHGPIDVQELDCDFLVCSGYKFFGPHTGILYGKEALLDQLYAYKVRPQYNDPPHKFEWGTLNHEGLAGLLGAIEYLESIGADAAHHYSGLYENLTGRRRKLKLAMHAISEYERELTEHCLKAFNAASNVILYGLKDLARLNERTPTFAINIEGWTPRAVTTTLAYEGLWAWHGNYYALEPMQRIGLEEEGGAIRISLVHYNTHEEIDRLAAVLRQL